MPLTFADWPFLPSDKRSNAETERWWAECHLPARAEVALRERPHWTIVKGGLASGKSTVLAALERYERDRSFILHYPPSAWPGSQQALKKEANHLGQIMTAASLALRKRLANTSTKLAPLSKTQREFVRWLIEKFDRPRAYARWIEDLPTAQGDAWREIAYEDFYPTSTEPLDVTGQIEELISLVHHLGFERILVLVDVAPVLSDEQINKLLELFSWYEIMHHTDFALAAAVPRHITEKRDLASLTRGRVDMKALEWSRDELHDITNRYIRAATAQPIKLSDLVTPGMMARLESIVGEEAGEVGPGAWLGLTETLLRFAAKNDWPVGEEHFSAVRRDYFVKYMPLRLEATSLQRGVWRGPHFIPLDEQPFNFLRVLCENEGRALDSEDRVLIGVAGSKGNIHTLARRVRKAIEPDDEPIYVKNLRSEGYWIENFIGR